MSSPARAASRRKALRKGTSPSTVMHKVKGPRVVSPPTSGQPYRDASASMPLENGSSQSQSSDGKASDKVKPSGRAPMAARSLKLTARALCPRASGATSAKKCRPCTSMSLDTASDMPGAGVSNAQSSPMPKGTRASSASALAGSLKYRRISSNSPMVGCVGRQLVCLMLLAQRSGVQARHRRPWQ